MPGKRTSNRSEREAVLRERVAFARGRCAGLHEMLIGEPDESSCDTCVRRAKEVYPLPKVTRPRVVTIDREKYRIAECGGLERHVGERWWSVAAIMVHNAPAVADLLANPTEECEDEP